MRLLTLILFLFALATYGAGIPEKIRTDYVQIGKQGSTDTKNLVFDVGDGGTNPALQVNTTDKTFDFSTGGSFLGDLSLGTGAAADQKLIFDIGAGASNPFFKWDNAQGKLTFSNDGTLEKKIGSGSGSGGSGGINLLANSGAEDGTLSWTNSGGTFSVVPYTNPTEDDTQHFRFVATGAGQYVESVLATVPDNLGFGCMADLQYFQGDNAFTYTVLDSANNPLSSGDISDLSEGWLKAPTITLRCPDAGETFKLRVEATGAGTIDFDSAYLGSNKGFISGLTQSIVGQSELGSSFQTTGLVGDLTISNLAIGRRYKIEGVFSIGLTSVSENSKDFVADILNGATILQTVGTGASNVFNFRDTLPILKDFVATSSTITVNVNTNSNASLNAGAFLNVYEIFETQEAFSPEQASFEVAGKIFETTNSGITATQSSVPNPWLDPELQLTVDKGAAEIACSGGETPSGITCQSNSEEIGFVVNFPRSGKYEVCFNSVLYSGGNHQLTQRIYMMNSITESSYTQGIRGRGIHSVGGTNVYTSDNLCDVFEVSSIGKRKFMLQHEATNPDTQILPDRNGSASERDVSFTVKMADHNVSRPLVDNQVSTRSRLGSEKGVCHAINTGSVSFDSSDPDCWFINNFSRIDVGRIQVNLISEGFKCTTTALQVERIASARTIGGGQISTPAFPQSFEVITDISSSGTNDDVSFSIACSKNK